MYESPEMGEVWYIKGIRKTKQQEPCVNIRIANKALIGKMLETFTFALKLGSRLQGTPV